MCLAPDAVLAPPESPDPWTRRNSGQRLSRSGHTPPHAGHCLSSGGAVDAARRSVCLGVPALGTAWAPLSPLRARRVECFGSRSRPVVGARPKPGFLQNQGPSGHPRAASAPLTRVFSFLVTRGRAQARRAQAAPASERPDSSRDKGSRGSTSGTSYFV